MNPGLIGEGSSTTTRTPEAPILVVDDQADQRLSVISVLEALGQPIVEAESGEAALRAVMTRSFAVILMDIQMPDMDGYETASLIRMREEHTPIVFVTARAPDELEIPVAYEGGAFDFIHAPFASEVLRAKVSIFVELFLKSRALERSAGQFRDSEARIRAVLDNVADGIVTVSDAGVIESFNRAASDLFGYREQEAIGQPFALMVGPKAVGRRMDGSTFPMEVDMSDVEVGAGTIHIGCLRDISERQTYTEALEHQALHDALTGLPNRVLFADRVTHALQTAMRTGESLALLIMDLDGFKEVNDTLGHQHGDALLKLVTERLVGCLRDGDTVARLGGDEFGVLAGGDIDLAGAATVVWEIQQALEAPFLVSGRMLDVRASIGITLAPTHGDHIDDLLRRADLAMYEAKRSGAGYALFSSGQEEIPARRLALLGDLRNCIERDQLVLHYQPKVDLATLETVGVEALIRWNHPSGRLVMPEDFVPEVERGEMTIPMTDWVLKEAIRQLGNWRDEGYDLTMAVNLGARCLGEGTTLAETIERLMSRWAIPRDRLIFELTESALIDPAVPGLMPRLKSMDERLSIDNFGTGHSSLVDLQRLPVVEIKVDRSFVTTMSTAEDDAAIVRSIIELARNLGLNVAAEGVEDEATMNLLLQYGCDAAQGNHFSRPLPGDDIVPWLEKSSYGSRRIAVAEKA